MFVNDNEYTGNIKYKFWFEDISLTLLSTC